MAPMPTQSLRDAVDGSPFLRPVLHDKRLSGLIWTWLRENPGWATSGAIHLLLAFGADLERRAPSLAEFRNVVPVDTRQRTEIV